MNKFHKVSYGQFLEAYLNLTDGVEEAEVRKLYENIKLPCRATIGSAGYDFFAPYGFSLEPGESVKIPTGIRVELDDGIVLICMPRSSFGFKYRLQLDNTVGVIDSDYFHANNEGHIYLKMTNCGDKTLVIQQGEAIAQGILLPFFVTDDDDSTATRIGGFGSTNV